MAAALSHNEIILKVISLRFERTLQKLNIDDAIFFLFGIIRNYR